jgi:L-fuconolactonase
MRRPAGGPARPPEAEAAAQPARIGAARVDSHQHFWKYDPAEYGWIDENMAALKRDFLPEDLHVEMRRAGMDACVAVQARQILDETDWLLDLAERHVFVAGVVGWVDLRAADVRRQLERYRNRRKLVGIRHIVQAEPDDRFLLRDDFCRGVAVLEEFDLAYDILIYPRQLEAAIEFVKRFPKQRFVLDHLAKPEIRTGAIDDWARGLRRLAAADNVLCKLSGLVTEADWSRWTPEQMHPYLDVAFDCFGYERLMIGSDWPVCTLAGDYARTLAAVSDYLKSRPEHERTAVLGDNARRFWRLEIQERTR